MIVQRNFSFIGFGVLGSRIDEPTTGQGRGCGPIILPTFTIIANLSERIVVRKMSPVRRPREPRGELRKTVAAR